MRRKMTTRFIWCFLAIHFNTLEWADGPTPYTHQNLQLQAEFSFANTSELTEGYREGAFHSI